MSVSHNYIVINYIWLHVSTYKKSSSGHLNLNYIWLHVSTFSKSSSGHLNVSYIWLHVSAFTKSSSGHLNLFLLTSRQYIWNVSSLWDPIQLYNGYTDKTLCVKKVSW
jgi:hypothetical protein